MNFLTKENDGYENCFRTLKEDSSFKRRRNIIISQKVREYKFSSVFNPKNIPNTLKNK